MAAKTIPIVVALVTGIGLGLSGLFISQNIHKMASPQSASLPHPKPYNWNKQALATISQAASWVNQANAMIPQTDYDRSQRRAGYEQAKAMLANLVAANLGKPEGTKALGLLRLIQANHQTTGVLEWNSIADDGTSVICGASTAESYISRTKPQPAVKQPNPDAMAWQRAGCFDSEPSEQNAIRTWIKIAKARFGNRVRDPDSTRYRDIHAMLNLETNEIEICGEINAPNGFGGYDGYSQFISTAKELSTDIGDETGGMVAVLIASRWPQECVKSKFARNLPIIDQP